MRYCSYPLPWSELLYRTRSRISHTIWLLCDGVKKVSRSLMMNLKKEEEEDARRRRERSRREKNEKTARLVHFTAILFGCLVQVNITFIHIHQDTCTYTHKHAYTHAYINSSPSSFFHTNNRNLKNNSGIIFPKIFKMALN